MRYSYQTDGIKTKAGILYKTASKNFFSWCQSDQNVVSELFTQNNAS